MLSLAELTIVLSISLSLVNAYEQQISPTSLTGTTETFDTSRDYEFEFDTINCSTSDCIVICDTDHGCWGTTIDASQSNTLKLQCSENGSCRSLILKSGAQISNEIECNGEHACWDTTIDASESDTLKLQCSEHYSCRSLILNSNAQSNEIECNGEMACWISSIYATNSTDLTVGCNGEHACSSTAVYCPLQNNGKCDINCVSYNDSCQSIDIHIPGNYKANVNCDGNAGCNGIDIHCGITDSWYNIYSSSKSNLRLAFILLCQENRTLDCNEYGQGDVCVVDCSYLDCTDVVIDGSNVSTSLTVDCGLLYDGSGGCDGATIKCPDTYSTATCSVDCPSDRSCQNIAISNKKQSPIYNRNTSSNSNISIIIVSIFAIILFIIFIIAIIYWKRQKICNQLKHKEKNNQVDEIKSNVVKPQQKAKDIMVQQQQEIEIQPLPQHQETNSSQQQEGNSKD